MIRKRKYPTYDATIPQFESVRFFMDGAVKYLKPSIKVLDSSIYAAVAPTRDFSKWLSTRFSCDHSISTGEISFFDVSQFWWKNNRKNNILLLNRSNPFLELHYYTFLRVIQLFIKTVDWSPLELAYLDTKSVSGYLDHNNAQAVYLDNTEKIIIKTKDQLRNAKVLDSKAEIYAEQCLYVEALNDLHKNLSIAEKSESPMQLMFVNRQLALLYIQLEDYIQAQKYLEDALTLSRSKVYLKSDEYDILKIKLELNKKLGNQSEEFTILKRLNELRDSIDYTDNEQSINAITLKYQKGLYDERFRLNQTILEKEVFLNHLLRVVFVLIFLIIIILIIAYLMKIKNKTINLNREILHLQYEKLNLEKNISEHNYNPITSQSTDYNTPLVAVTYPIEKRGKVLEPSNSFVESKLPDLLKSHLMTEENWIGFKRAFIEEFPLFYDNLKTHYPELTEYNLRVIFLTKLQLTNHEIASTLGVSYDAVKKAKQRLRKKVEEPSVEDFIKIWT
ncbi:tetratricopeptide repeat protein [Flavobacterium sp. HSC-61S13]|uniref:transcriptional regulator n=1 Tax=Flavobacterium sp. HSC-61S13 TaxID=2910963 RepID=UPI00209F19DA|nr:tetratricopeptide repeat protein [Flavobacterium sp. HSC-61S13]